MQVVLQARVPNLGLAGDLVTVKNGYGRNSLLPKGLAVLATKQAIEQAEALRTKAKETELTRLKETETRVKALDGKAFTIKVKADDNGKLFGAVTVKDILERVNEDGRTFAESDLSWQPRKELGNFKAIIQPEKGMRATISITIERE